MRGRIRKGSLVVIKAGTFTGSFEHPLNKVKYVGRVEELRIRNRLLYFLRHPNQIRILVVTVAFENCFATRYIKTRDIERYFE